DRPLPVLSPANPPISRLRPGCLARGVRAAGCVVGNARESSAKTREDPSGGRLTTEDAGSLRQSLDERVPHSELKSEPTSITKTRSFFGHPWGLANLAGVEMWERFSFYGMQGLLAYYIYYSATDGGLGMSEA